MQIKKFTLGLKSSTKLFKVSSEWGSIIDSILDQRGAALSDDYYTRIAETESQGIISLLNEKLGNILTIDREGVVIQKSGYLSEKRVDLDETFDEFKKIWTITNKLVNMRDVRRMGMVVEWRFKADTNSSADLLTKLTRLPSVPHPGAFTLRYQSRRTPATQTISDLDKSDFVNVITEMYDSAIDGDKPEKGMINVNLDYQHYFAPPILKNVSQKVEEHYFQLKKELKALEEQVENIGLQQHAK